MSEPQQPTHRFIVDPDEEEFLHFIVTRGPLAGKTIKLLSYEGAHAHAGMAIELDFFYELLDSNTQETVRLRERGDAPTLDDTHRWIVEIVMAYIINVTEAEPGDDDG